MTSATVAVIAATGVKIKWDRQAAGASAFRRFGTPVPDALIESLTRTRIALKGPLTLSFIAYAGNLKGQTDAARQAAHELLVHVPWEGAAGPATREETLRRLRWDLARFA